MGVASGANDRFSLKSSLALLSLFSRSSLVPENHPHMWQGSFPSSWPVNKTCPVEVTRHAQ